MLLPSAFVAYFVYTNWKMWGSCHVSIATARHSACVLCLVGEMVQGKLLPQLELSLLSSAGFRRCLGEDHSVGCGQRHCPLWDPGALQTYPGWEILRLDLFFILQLCKGGENYSGSTAKEKLQTVGHLFSLTCPNHNSLSFLLACTAPPPSSSPHSLLRLALCLRQTWSGYGTRMCLVICC